MTYTTFLASEQGHQFASQSVIVTSSLDYYGLPVFEFSDRLYAAATIAQAEAVARQIARDHLYEIRTDLIVKHANLSPAKAASSLVSYIQQRDVEEGQALLLVIVPDINKLIDEAVQAQGRNYFLGLWSCQDEVELPLPSFPQHLRSTISQALGVEESEIYLYGTAFWMLRSRCY